MNLYGLLRARAAAEQPIRVGIIGCGKFGSMFLAQARRTPGMHIVGVADRDVARARKSLSNIGWPDALHAARSLDEAASSATTCVTDDADALIRAPSLDVLIEATGSPPAGVRHALAAIDHGKHLVMVNVYAASRTGPSPSPRACSPRCVYQ